ncbi:hypothetical protein ACK3TF_004565 [Chlorella vulgaris]
MTKMYVVRHEKFATGSFFLDRDEAEAMARTLAEQWVGVGILDRDRDSGLFVTELELGHVYADLEDKLDL